MILSDNETKLDLLNNQAIAKTIVSIIQDSKESVSIGVHGDWGAGKSSILAMVEDEVKTTVEKTSKDKKPFKAVTIRFNGWQHQGFEDSKVALISAIVSQLVAIAESHPVKEATKNVKEIAKNLWKNINWLSVAKKAGTIGFSLTTGAAPLTVLINAIEALKGYVDSKEHVEETIGAIGDYVQKASISEDTSSLKEFNEFRDNFRELLEAAEIDKLVVIIDDLDRCLPPVAIETLEAIRLFMFMEETAFVIGADEVMIRYAVKKHFPDMEKEVGINLGDSFADKYLEKLIQIPFRIPALGPVETQIYTILLFVGTELDAKESEGYKKLIEATRKRLETPWDPAPFDITDVKNSMGDEEYGQVSNKVLLAIQISPILYKHSRGNPRVVKRFINMLLLRDAVAKNRGYGKKIDLKILAKLMLAENKWPEFYKNIALHLVDGKSPELAYFEEVYNESDKEGADISRDEISPEDDKKPQKVKKSTRKPKADKPENCEWITPEEYKEWIESEPLLKGIDLRPYYTACKEKIDFFGGLESDEALREIVDILMRDEATVLGSKGKVTALSEENANKAFDVVATNVTSSGNLTEMPNGFEGLRVLVEVHPMLRTKILDLVFALPLDEVGEWILTGWERSIPTGCDEYIRLEELFDKVETSGSDEAKLLLEVKKGMK